MNSQNIAIVSCRVDAYPARHELRDALDQQLSLWLQQLGLTPLLLPNTLPPQALPALLDQLQPALLVLSGGNDIGLYPTRDALETALLDQARQRQLSVLGICRGMQMLAQYAGTGLSPVKGHVASRHTLQGIWHGEVNSFHQWALCGLPAGYQLLAHSADGTIEAIRHQQLRWIGIMWHPERAQPFCPQDLLRIAAE